MIDGRAIIATLLAALGTIAAAAYAAPQTTENLARRLTFAFPRTRRVPTLLVLAFAVLIPVIIADVVLDRFQNSGDEFAYFFQAKMFAHGQLWAPAPPLGDTFVPYRTWIIGDKWLSQYPPGWPLAMAAAIVAGIPAWCVNALLDGISVAALLSRQWGHRDRAIVLMVGVLYVLTPFYLMNAGSYYSHMLPALLITLLCLMCLWYQRERRTLALIISGVLVGLIGLTRYFSLILLLPALMYWWIVECRHDRLRVLGVVVVSGIPFLALLMTYQDWITGSPFHNTYSLISNDDTFVSFLPGAVTRGALLTFYRFGELSLWAVPLLVPTYLFCMASKLRNRSIAFYDLIFPSFVIGYVFFADLGGEPLWTTLLLRSIPDDVRHPIVGGAPGRTMGARDFPSPAGTSFDGDQSGLSHDGIAVHRGCLPPSSRLTRGALPARRCPRAARRHRHHRVLERTRTGCRRSRAQRCRP